jgi:HlyD family secretion protein
MKKSVKIGIMAIIILAAVGGTVTWMMTPLPVGLTGVTAKTVELSFTEQGTVVADSVMQVYPLAQGQLVQVNVAQGQSVRKGDILCEIDAEPLRLRIGQIEAAISSYEAQMRYAQEQVSSANATTRERIAMQNTLIAQNKAVLERAKIDLSRTQALYTAGGISQAELDLAQGAVDTLEVSLLLSQQELAVIVAGGNQIGQSDYYQALIQIERANMAQLQRDIESCVVLSPVEGTVTQIYAKATNYIMGASPVAEITLATSNKIEAYVSTNDVENILIGDMVDLTMKRRDGDIHFFGEVTQIDATAQVKLSALGMEERRIKVGISPALGDAGIASLGVGYNIDVRFIYYREENQIAVPKTALFKDGGKDMVWVVREGNAQAVEVVKGMELRTETVIKSGLREGDQVVTEANNSILAQGRRVVAR